MPFTELGRGSGSGSLAPLASGTFNITLNAAPTSGTWVVATYTTNRNNSVVDFGFIRSVTCGTVPLTRIETMSLNVPELWGAPYASGMSTTLTTNWYEPTTGSTTALYNCSLVFSGASTVLTSGTGAFAFTQSGGSFDGGGSNTYGATGNTTTSGTIAWANSNNAIPTSYDTQQEPFIAAFYNNSATTNLTTPKQLNATFSASVTAGGFLTTAFQTPGVVLLTSTTTVAASGKGVVYAPSGNFVFNYTAVPLATVLSGCTTNAPVGTTVPTSAQVMLPVNFTANILEIVPSTNSFSGTLGGFQTGNVSYTGASTANGYVQIAIAGGTTAGRLTLIGGSATSGAAKTSAYGQLRIGGTGTSNGGGLIYTFVPSTRSLTRTSRVSISFTDALIRSKLSTRISQVISSVRSFTGKIVFNRRALPIVQTQSTSTLSKALKPRSIKLTQTNSNSVSKSTGFNRFVRTSQIQTISIIRKLEKIRTATVSKFFNININRKSIFNRSPQVTQSVTATVIRRKTTKRGISIATSYTIGVSRRSTFLRRAIASSSMTVQTTKLRGKGFLITVGSNVTQLRGRIFLIVSSVSWKMSSNINAKIIIPAKGLFNNSMLASSPDYQRPDTTDFEDQNQTQISDDVPTEIVEIDDELGTSVVPFIE